MGWSYIDYIFAMTLLVGKHRELKIPTFVALIDYTKAFDRVNRSKLWEIMEEKGFP
jgi:hypothetical protein